MMPALALALTFAVSHPTPTPLEARAMQWLYREHSGAGQRAPTAIFLSYEYSSVIFRATCGETPGTLELRYFPGLGIGSRDAIGTLRIDRLPPIILARGERAITLRTNAEEDFIVGQVVIDPPLLDLLRPTGNHELMIETINEMDEPFYVGDAEPLYRLARICNAER